MNDPLLTILLNLVDKPTQLENSAHVAEIFIGIATFFSLWFSRQALKKSDWNSALSSVPSILLEEYNRSYVTLGDDHSAHTHSGYEITETSPGIEKIGVNIEFKATNSGRGTAFNLQKIKIESSAEYRLIYGSSPLYLKVDSDGEQYFSFRIQMVTNFENWKKICSKESKIIINLEYDNDQGNVKCISKWSAEFRPFSIINGKLITNKDKLLNSKGAVLYSPR